MNEKIKALYDQLAEKQDFCHDLADEIGMKGQSIFNHWFGRKRVNIPEKHQETALKALEKEIKRQLKDQEEALNMEVETNND